MGEIYIRQGVDSFCQVHRGGGNVRGQVRCNEYASFDSVPDFAHDGEQETTCSACSSALFQQFPYAQPGEGALKGAGEVTVPAQAIVCWKYHVGRQDITDPSQLVKILKDTQDQLPEGVYGKVQACRSVPHGVDIVFYGRGKVPELEQPLREWADVNDLDLVVSNGCLAFFEPVLGTDYGRLPEQMEITERQGVDLMLAIGHPFGLALDDLVPGEKPVEADV
jgi:hypothetical protein